MRRAVWGILGMVVGAGLVDAAPTLSLAAIAGPSPLVLPVNRPSPARIRELTGMLGSPDYRIREKAGRSIEAAGEQSLPELKRILLTTEDQEIARRLQVLIRKLEADRLGQPRRVSVHMVRKPIKEILAEIGKQSGYAIKFEGGGDDKALHSFEFSELPFWEALDRVCDATGYAANQQDDEGTVTVFFNDTYNPYTTYAGPFKIIATNMNSGRNLQLAGQARRQPLARQPEFINLNLTLQSEPKAPIVGIGQTILTKAIDENGASMIPTEIQDNGIQVWSLYSPQIAFRSFTQSFSVALNRADRTATTLKEVRGKVAVSLLSEVRPELVVNNLLTVKKGRFPGRSIDLEIASVDFQNNLLAIELTVKQRQGNPEDFTWLNTVSQRLEVLDAQGKRYQFNGINNQNNGPNVTTLQLQFVAPPQSKLGPPTRLQYVEWLTINREIEFTFRDVPLP